MKDITKRLLQVFIVVLCQPISAFAPTTLVKHNQSPLHHGLPRSLPIVHSAKILPVAYTGAAASLFYKATKTSNKVDMAVLVATGALALFNLGPMDNARLASAKKAYKNTDPAVSGLAKQERQAALTWRFVVRMKLVGQLIGLVRMATAKTGFGILRGAAFVMGSNMAFFMCGAGYSMHDNDGRPTPMEPSKSRAILGIDSTLTIAALLAASSPIDSQKRLITGGIFAFGALVGALEGLAGIVTSSK